MSQPGPLAARGSHDSQDSFTRPDRAAGYRYEVSILHAEFSLTQVYVFHEPRTLDGQLSVPVNDRHDTALSW
jgi:hypothetical protein